MTKIRLTIDLELPDVDDWEDPFIRDAVWTSYIHYVTTAHARDSLTWLFNSQKEPDNISARQIYEIHKNWSDIAQAAQYTIEIIRAIDTKPEV